jgi:hypothetical protein
LGFNEETLARGQFDQAGHDAAILGYNCLLPQKVQISCQLAFVISNKWSKMDFSLIGLIVICFQ